MTGRRWSAHVVVVVVVGIVLTTRGGLLLEGAGAGWTDRCPARCSCASPRTVRCIFQALRRVPRVPASTRVLDLRFNEIAELRPDDFRGLDRLETLLLDGNLLRGLPASAFAGAPALGYLGLRGNGLERLDPAAFAGLGRLEQLHLQDNRLRDIPAGAFAELPGLETLYLQNNSIEALTVEAFGGGAAVAAAGPAARTTRLRLDGNDIVCDCGLLWLAGRGRRGGGAGGPQAVAECRAPSEMRGRRLADLAPEEFHCSRPIITEGPEDLELRLGERAELRCRAAGEPRPRIKWMRDSSEVPSDGERYRLTDDGSLLIPEVTENDAGDYECVAQNEMGMAKSRSARTLVVNGPTPEFVETPKSQTVRAGTDVVLVCRALGGPSTRVEWWRNGARVRQRGRLLLEDEGSSLKILAAKEADSARYVCQARNGHGFAETSADLRVIGGDYKPPRLVHEPQDMEVEAGAIVELACRAEGQPAPRIAWRKDGAGLEADGTRVSRHGSLYLYNVTGRATGRYECSATNEHGRVSAAALVRVRERSAGDALVLRAFKEASREVERAIGNTLNELFRPGPRADPFRLSRFPNAVARQAARPAELFERTLQHVRRMVDSGAYANATDDFVYEEIMTAEQLADLERLSGCTSHRRAEPCLNLCYHSRYRTHDGKCNNLAQPTWGSSYTGFRRLLRPVYENGFSQPVGWDRTRLYHGHPVPPARLVSSSLLAAPATTDDERLSHMAMQWGQWLDHDLDHALPAVSSESWGGIDCKKSCENAAPCFPMEVPAGDPRIKNRRCIDFFRTSAVCGSGETSVLWGKLTPREQLNQLTSYLDASQVYGYADDVARGLRALDDDLGLLREGPSFPGRKPLLPYSDGQFVDCRRNLSASPVGCFLAGDFRANEQIGLTAMHTIWMREHNRVARRLKLVNAHWRGEKLYQEARKIVGAQMQVITYRDWIPLVLGKSSDELLGSYQGYDKDLDASISNVFATAALRFGHSLIQPKLERLNEDLQSIPQGPLHLRDAFFAPWRLVDEGGVDPLLRGMFVTPAKLKKPEQNLNIELTEQLFHIAHAVALDLAAMNIQRGRDHAVPPYNNWRRYCNMSTVETFDDLAKEISSTRVRQILKKLYGHPGNIDVWVGGILEDQLPNAKVGPLFRCLLTEQFKRMRDGDRFWLENPTIFRVEQLREIKKTSLARILCDNSDNITRIQRNVFLLPEVNNNLISCDEIPSVDLRVWSDCCEECIDQNNQSDILARSRRSAAEKYLATANKYTEDNIRSDKKSVKIKDLKESLKSTIEEYNRISKVLRDLKKRIIDMGLLIQDVNNSN